MYPVTSLKRTAEHHRTIDIYSATLNSSAAADKAQSSPDPSDAFILDSQAGKQKRD